MYGIYANIWGILMVNVTIYIAYMDPMGYGPVLIWDVGQRCSVGLHVKTILSTETGSWSLSHAGQALGSTVSHMESLLLFSYFPLKPLEAKDSLPVASCFSIVLAVVFACRFLTKIVSILWLLQVRPNAKWRMIIWACLGSQLKATGIHQSGQLAFVCNPFTLLLPPPKYCTGGCAWNLTSWSWKLEYSL